MLLILLAASSPASERCELLMRTEREQMRRVEPPFGAADRMCVGG